MPEEPGNAAARFREQGVRTITVPLHRLRAVRNPRPHLGLISRLPREVRRIRAVIEQEDIELVVIGGLPNPHGALAGRLAGVPVVWQIIDTRLPLFGRRLIKPAVVRLADVVMTTGVTVGREFSISDQMPERWVPFYSPVDVEAFAPDPARHAAARAELGLELDQPVVGTVGNINLQKGYPTFIEAAAELRRHQPNTRFVILGATHDTHRRFTEELWGHAGELGLMLGRELVVRDPGSRVSELASALDVFWLCSEPRSEGVSTVVMEAMSLGIPVVATDVGGIADIVEDGVNGLLVPPRSPDAQASATLPILRDPERRAEMGRAGRSAAEREFRTEKSVDAHLRAFELALRHRSEACASAGVAS